MNIMQKLQKIIKAAIYIFFMLTLMANGSRLLVSSALASEQKGAPEYLIKAGYLYKFFFFINWPDMENKSSGPIKNITIGILGDDPFKDYFKPIDGQEIKALNRKVHVARLGPYEEGMVLDHCQIIFVGLSEKKNLKRILYRTMGKAILTVGDIKGFTEMGGMINLVDVGGLVRWELNLNAIRESGLTVSATLVQSAVKIKR